MGACRENTVSDTAFYQAPGQMKRIVNPLTGRVRPGILTRPVLHSISDAPYSGRGTEA